MHRNRYAPSNASEDNLRAETLFILLRLLQLVSGKVAEMLAAEIHRISVLTEVDGGETVLHSPNVAIKIVAHGNRYGLSLHRLQDEHTSVILSRKCTSVGCGNTVFFVVNRLKFHRKSSIF
jgi:hypothetical protein